MPQHKKNKPVPQYRWAVILVGIGFIALVMLLFMTYSPVGIFSEPGSASTVGDFVLICIALCPMLICGFVLYALLVVTIYGINIVERSSRTQLQKAKRATRTVADKTGTVADNLSERSISIGSRLAWLDRVFKRHEDGDSTAAEEVESHE